MKLQALLDEIAQAVESDDSTANTHVVLAQKISNLADMVGWADGPIDPERRLADRFGSFMESLARAMRAPARLQLSRCTMRWPNCTKRLNATIAISLCGARRMRNTKSNRVTQTQ